MPLTVGAADLALRLGCALIAGVVIGINRGEHGKAAGLRTTALACLAACVAMIQVNDLLVMTGKTSDSFITNDLMRLPLGILTGVGFIGAGAIVRRGDFVVGVTTAATIWYVTVIGLCFGGNQILLGWVATAIGCVILWGFKWIESLIPVERRSRVVVVVDETGPSHDQVRGWLRAGAYVVHDAALGFTDNGRSYSFDVVEQRVPGDTHAAPVIASLHGRPGVRRVEWLAASP